MLPALGAAASRGNHGRTNTAPVPFANDPYRGPPLSLAEQWISPLLGPHFLSTALVDFLIQRAMPGSLANNVLIGSANSMTYLEMMNKKKINSSDRSETKTTRSLRLQYQYYSIGLFHYIAATCSNGHFVVIHVIFDVRDDKIFRQVHVYDSLRRTGRHADAVNKNSIGAQFLRQLQLFLSKYAFYDHPNNEILVHNPDYILKEARYTGCPAQENSHDCALFAFATLLHIVHGEEVNATTFSHDDIENLRHDLYIVLSAKIWGPGSPFPDPKQQLSAKFLCSYFPLLSVKESGSIYSEEDPYIAYICKKQRGVEDSSADDDEQQEDESVFEDNSSFSSPGSSPDEDSFASVVGSNEDETQVESTKQSSSAPETEDRLFVSMFLETPTAYETLRQVDVAMDNYEAASGFRVVIKKSQGDYARTYKCGSHLGCCFRVKFGKIRNKEEIVVKTKFTHPYHSGSLRPTKARDGRRLKKRLKGRLDSSVATVGAVKDGDPVPRDIMKAAANLDGIETTYHQSFRAIRSVTSNRHEEDHVRSFQLIIPYLNKFVELNPGSHIDWERDNEKNIERFFLCPPGLMKTCMRYVRPVMSLDAAHLRSEWQGTLYVASVLTACNDIFPVAVSIMRENENEEGWKWFLRNLKSSIEVLVMDHPKPKVSYKYYTFLSDRQKGLINALADVFPENHATFCSVHIQRNMEKHHGKKVSAGVIRLSKTFSRRLEADILAKIGETSSNGLAYLEEIPPSQWRSTSWLDDPTLPPRYGIVSTNMSESVNSMFEKCRDGSWLRCIDAIITKMVVRIAELREKYKGRSGIVDNVAGLLTKRWQMCAGFRVLEMQENGSQFIVYRPPREGSDATNMTSYMIDILERSCDCGLWQDHGVPCIDAMAYFRLKCGVTLEHVLENEVCDHYSYKHEKEILRKNIAPVCLDIIRHDGATLPPLPQTKRSSGRPKRVRIRNRTRWAYEPEKSSIVCSRCGKKGHNKRTCLAREEAKQESSSRGGGAELDLS